MMVKYVALSDLIIKLKKINRSGATLMTFVQAPAVVPKAPSNNVTLRPCGKFKRFKFFCN